jgi:nicotinamidase-related amidase
MPCDFSCQPLTTALLIIDMQRYFTRTDSTFSRLSALRTPAGSIEGYGGRLDSLVIPNILLLRQAFRKNGSPVFYTRMGSNREDGGDLPIWARRINEAGRAGFDSPVFPPLDDPNAQIDERLAPHPDERILTKSTISALATSSLEPALRALGITTVVVSGVLSAYCVTQTARELADRNFDVALVENACASLTEAAHDAALGAFAAVYGWVLPTEEMLAAINGGRTL